MLVLKRITPTFLLKSSTSSCLVFLKLLPSVDITKEPMPVQQSATTVRVLLFMNGVITDGLFFQLVVLSLPNTLVRFLPLSRMGMITLSLVCKLLVKLLASLCTLLTVLMRTRCSISLCSAVLPPTISKTVTPGKPHKAIPDETGIEGIGFLDKIRYASVVSFLKGS